MISLLPFNQDNMKLNICDVQLNDLHKGPHESMRHRANCFTRKQTNTVSFMNISKQKKNIVQQSLRVASYAVLWSKSRNDYTSIHTTAADYVENINFNDTLYKKEFYFGITAIDIL